MGYRGTGAPRGCCGAIRGCIWGLAGTVGTQARGGYRGIGAPKGVLGLLWGNQGGVRVYLGGKWTGSPTTLVPSPGSQHSHWFPWGSDLPGQGQASDRNELCRLLYTFGTVFHDSFRICIFATSSHILTHNVKKCYMDYFL